jgi:hypothetical protein
MWPMFGAKRMHKAYYAFISVVIMHSTKVAFLILFLQLPDAKIRHVGSICALNIKPEIALVRTAILEAALKVQ